MKVIRKGNDILIMWCVTRLGVPENFEGKRVEVRLLDKYNAQVPFEYSISKNIITGTFFGRSQCTPGPYHLMLIENEDKRGQVILDSKDIFAIRDYLPDTTSVGGDHISDMVEVKVDSSINSLAGLCVTKLWYNDGTGNCNCEDCTGNDSEEHEYNLMDVEIIVPEGHTGRSAKVYSKEKIDAMKTASDQQLEDGIANLHDTITEEMTDELSYKLDKTEYEANRATDKAELDSYKNSQSAEFEAYVAKQKAEFEAYVENAHKELEAAQTKAKNDLDEYADDFQSEYETFKTNNTLLINAKANTTDVAAADATLQANIDSVRSSLQTNIDSVKSTLQSNIDSVRSSLQTNIDTNKAAFDSHVTNAKVEFDAHVAAAQKSLDDHIADFTTEQGVFDAYKLSMQQALDGYVAKAKSDLDKHSADAKAQLDNHIVEFNALKSKVEADIENLAALQAEFDSYKVTNQAALDTKANKTDVIADLAKAKADMKADMDEHEADVAGQLAGLESTINTTKTDIMTEMADKATREYVDTVVVNRLGESVSTADLAAVRVVLQEKIDAKADKTEIPDISGLATKEEVNAVDAKVDAITVPTKTSELENDSNYLTEHQDISGLATKEEVTTGLASKANTTDIPDVSNLATKAEVEAVDAKVDAIIGIDTGNLATKEEVNAVDAKVDAITVPTKTSELENDSNYLTEHQDISGLATKEEVNAVDAKVDAITVPTKTSELENDSNYLTEHQDISGLATKEEVTTGLASKANTTDIPDVSNLATKEEVTTGLASKANTTDIPDVSNFATKTEVDTKMAGMVKVQKLTQSEYDALTTKGDNVLYAIIEG